MVRRTLAFRTVCLWTPLFSYAADEAELLIFTHAVQNFGAVADDGKDDSAAFQAALDAAHKEGGGIVYASKGQYDFQGHLTIPAGVTLRGDWEPPPAKAGGAIAGTVLRVFEQKGKEDGDYFIACQNSSCVRDVAIFYPEQSVDVGKVSLCQRHM